ncbi:MAG: MFS transporter [Phycisphaerae bacterium]|nr:MFS transporter [Phycisphaerae bacterium]
MSTPTQPSLNAIDDERSMFVVEGKSVLFTFCLVSSLFLLWGLLNGMIDVMDKHFQNELNLSLGESAWVQFAHWIGYFLMSLPAGWLATRLGYRIGIVTGLLLVAAGGFWFIPAASVYKAFWAFLLGVCVVAAGLAFLETVANPYTTVLGPKRWSATRINIAQSCNGVGWLLGPFVGALFFYGEHPKLWIPYATVAVVVLVLAGIFSIAPMPDVKAKDDYSIDENADPDAAPQSIRKVNRGLSYVLLLGCLTALVGVFGMISWLILNSLDAGQRLMGFASKLPRPEGFPITAESALLITIIFAGCVVIAIGAMWLIAVTKRLTHHSIWSHEHFTGAVLAQFFYVAAQASIFGFVINYMVAEPPSLPSSWLNASQNTWVSFEVRTALARSDFKDVPSLIEKLAAQADPVSVFIASRLSDTTKETVAQYQAGTASENAARVAIQQDLKSIVHPKESEKDHLYTPERFSGIELQGKTKEVLNEFLVLKAAYEQVKQDKQKAQPAQDAVKRCEPRLNRMLLADAYPKELAFVDGVVSITDRTAANLVIILSACFLLGRMTGAAMLRRVSAHKIVGLYAVLNVLAALVVFCRLGWVSVASVFLIYFFMSIMFPTIFALGIFGLGKRAKGASAYIVMAIAGGALLPKLMGAISEHYDLSKGFIVPLVSFAMVALYGYAWPKLSRAESLHGVGASGRH